MQTRKGIVIWRRIVLPLMPILALCLLPFAQEQKASALVTVVEFSDFQCPYCKRAAGMVEQLRQSYGNKVKLVFKQMPLPMHQYAFKAAQGSVCAQQQGKFWEYHDRLFAASDLSSGALNRIAAEVGLNPDEFSQCLGSPTSRTIVEKEMAEAERLGVSGTPTFFVDGKVVRGAATFAALKQEIDGAMTKRNHPLLGSSNRGDSLFVENTASPLSTRPQVSASKDSAARAATTASGVMLSPASINFGYQLVGTTGSEVTETVTNSRTAPLVITEISVTGRDRRNFIPAYSFTLPVTVAPGNSIAINLSFTPSLPWEPGSRNARLVISEKKDSGRSGKGNERQETSEEKDEDKDEARDSQSVPLTGIGATCGGPLPSCASGCADTDNDGLNDAWEFAGGIDLNNDGEIDARHDLMLRGANPNKPDVYVKYDYMVKTGAGAHSHQPSRAALDQVVEAFAAHGVNLHFVAPNAGIPETVVTTLDPAPTLACAGPSVSTTKDLRAAYFGNRQPAYHYMVFAHRAVTPDLAHQAACPSDPTTGVIPDPNATGVADIVGDDAIIAFGSFVDSGSPIGIETMASTIMHELGHNFGLLHGGPDSVDFKPHYISVMNHAYQLSGIPVAVAPGSTNFRTCTLEPDCGPPAISTGECATPNACHCTNDQASGLGFEYCYRVDYAALLLPSLNELSTFPGVGGLDENLGVSGPASDTDVVLYFAPGPAQLLGASNGSPIDWNGDGAIGTHVSADINNDGTKTFLTTQNDWETSGGFFTHLNFRFQCTNLYGSPSP